MAGAGQNILGGSQFGSGGFNKMGKTIGSVKNRQVNYNPEHTFFHKEIHMAPKAQ